MEQDSWDTIVRAGQLGRQLPEDSWDRKAWTGLPGQDSQEKMAGGPGCTAGTGKRGQNSQNMAART